MMFLNKRIVRLEKKVRFRVLISGIVILVFLSMIVLLKVETISTAYISKDPLAEDSIKESMEKRQYSTVPEYSQTMERVVISLSEEENSLEYHHEILTHLPAYSKVVVLLPSANLNIVKSRAEKYRYFKKLEFAPYQIKQQNGASYYLVFPEIEKLVAVDLSPGQVIQKQGTIWARDLFTAVRQVNHKPLLLLPDIHKWFISYGKKSDNKIANDNAYLSNLASHNMDLVRSSLTFQGGNILVDTFQNKRIMFVGVNTLLSTRAVWKSTMDETPSNEKIVRMFKDYFQSDEIVVIGKNSLQPPSLMFHLDQAMIILKEGVAGVTNIVGHEKYPYMYSDEVKTVELFLEQVRSALLKLEYKVINIDTSVKNITDHQQYVNSIPFQNKKNGKKVILMPVFKDSDTKYDKILVEKNAEIFKSLDFDVVRIPTNAHQLNGGIHCLLNVVI